MTDEEYYGKMFVIGHKSWCQWGWDQYWWECDCGAVPVTELLAEYKRRKDTSRSAASTRCQEGRS